MRHQPDGLRHDVHVGTNLGASQQVSRGSRVRILGTITGDLIVDEGGAVELFGTISGDVHAAGRVNIHDGAIVSGRLLGDGVRDRRETLTTPSIRRWTL